MDAAGWNQRYATTDPVWTAKPNPFLVAEAEVSTTGEPAERVHRRITTGEGERTAIDTLVRARRRRH